MVLAARSATAAAAAAAAAAATHATFTHAARPRIRPKLRNSRGHSSAHSHIGVSTCNQRPTSYKSEKKVVATTLVATGSDNMRRSVTAARNKSPTDWSSTTRHPQSQLTVNPSNFLNKQTKREKTSVGGSTVNVLAPYIVAHCNLWQRPARSVAARNVPPGSVSIH